MLRELHGLGELEVQLDASRLPDFAELDPEKSYLGWEMLLKGGSAETNGHGKRKNIARFRQPFPRSSAGQTNQLHKSV